MQRFNRRVSTQLMWTMILALHAGRVRAQSEAPSSGMEGCSLKNHVYTCNSVAFQKALADAKRVSVETHNTDGLARHQVTDLVTGKLHKAIVTEGASSDLIFLLIPVEDGGQVNYNSGSGDIGTLRIYTATATGDKGRLIWAESFLGQRDVPWPVVVHGLIVQFESRFHLR